ncbi:MAG TPA: hypothetical protein VJQ61_13895, partial [Sinomonas sp.]|nr:hypothetical protein [Sinomonas sp.]
MENLLPPLIILLCVAAAVVLVLRRGARRTRASVEAAVASGPDAAAEASARLTEEQHRVIYSLIAQGLTVQAIAAYRQATGAKLIDARNAILLMERHPRAYGGTSQAEEAVEGRPDVLPEAASAPTAVPGPREAVPAEPAPAEPQASAGEAASSSADEPPKVPAGTIGERSTTR